jgi:hypothetical protein
MAKSIFSCAKSKTTIISKGYWLNFATLKGLTWMQFLKKLVFEIFWDNQGGAMATYTT